MRTTGKNAIINIHVSKSSIGQFRKYAKISAVEVVLSV